MPEKQKSSVESSLAIYNDVYVAMEKIRLQQPGAVPESEVAQKEVDLALKAVGDNLRPGDSVLDCPCGLGAQSNCLLQRNPGLKITAIDGSPALVKSAQETVGDGRIRFMQGYFNQIRDMVGLKSQKAVFCFKQSFGFEETVQGNVGHIQSMFDVLEDGGQLVLTWNFNPDEITTSKLDEHIEGPEIWGEDESGRKIGAYVLGDPPEKEDQIIPEDCIPTIGFDELRGESPAARANRTVSSSDRREYVFIDPDGQEIRSGSTEIRKYFKPVIRDALSDKNAPMEGDNRFYDLPLIRALCEHAGFVDVKCIPAKKINDRTLTGGIVATKPTSSGLKADEEALIAGVRTSLGLEAQENSKLHQYLQEYLGLEKEDTERIKLLKAGNLPKHFKSQREVLGDKRLEDVTVAVVPDDLWVKGNQPSESSAERQLILIKQSYFEAQEHPDEIAWLCHELAHCQNFLDSESPEAYQRNMQVFAFEDLRTKYPYPNNKVEQFTFTKQFQYLREQGKSREDVLAMLSRYYHKEDFPFFNRLLDSVYS